MAFFYLYKKKKQQLPHIFSKMFSSSVDRKQFHLHENLTPLSTLLPQHLYLLLLLLLLLSHFRSSSTSPGDWDTTLGSVSLHSIFLHQERSSGPTGMRRKAKTGSCRQTLMTMMCYRTCLRALSSSPQLPSGSPLPFSVPCPPQSSKASVQLHGQNVIN